MREFAGHELSGGVKLLLILRGDGRSDAFCFGQIDSAVEIGASGELARLGLPRAAANQFFEQQPRQKRIAGNVKFNDIFAGRALWGSERVNLRGKREIGKANSSALRGGGDELRFAGEMLMDFPHEWAAGADDHSGGSADRAADGGDGVGRIHATTMIALAATIFSYPRLCEFVQRVPAIARPNPSIRSAWIVVREDFSHRRCF